MLTPELQLLLKNREKLLGFIRKRVSDPEIAEDILQEGLLKALRTTPPADDNERLQAWFYRVLNNSIIDFYRHRGVEARYYDENQSAAEPPAALPPEAESLLCECFRDVLPALKPEYAQLIEKLELSGGNPTAVAQELGITPDNLKVRRHRARQSLRKKLEETCRLCSRHGCLDCTCNRN